MSSESTPADRLAVIAKLERKPTKQAFTWVFDEVDRYTVIEGGEPVVIETPVERERIITRTVVERDEQGRPLVEFIPPTERIVTEMGADGKKRVVSNDKGEPQRELIPGRWQEKTREETVIVDIPCTWAEDLAAAGIKDGPEATAYMHTEAMDYVVAFPGEDGVHRFAARDEPQLIEMIREHLAGYPGLKARVAEWRAGRGVPSADIIEEARNANPKLFSNTAPADPLGDALERQRIANARLLHKDDDINPQAPSDWDMDGQGVVEAMPAASNVPPEIAALLDEGETLTRDVRRKLTERLNVELAELKNLRGLAGEDLKREAEIEKLLGLFARLGEI